MFLPNLKSVASSVPEKKAIGVLSFWVGVANLQSGGRGGHRGVGDGTFQKSLGEFL